MVVGFPKTALSVLVVLAVGATASGVQPAPAEMARSRAWATAKLTGAASAAATSPGLVVLANHDPVQANSRAGKPLNIAGKQYTRGLYCHAASRIRVRLPSPARQFSAIVGVDSNSQTSGGRGSVVFSVSKPDKMLFTSDVLREGMAGVAVRVELGDATEFTIAVSDAGDGIACDQADWADARVTLADGGQLWLGDVPLFDEPPLTVEPPFSFVYAGKKSAELLPKWPCQRESRKLDDARTQHVVTYTDAASGLRVRSVAVEYHNFPVVEWTVYFRNTGSQATPLLKNVQALDAVWKRTSGGPAILHHFVGSLAEARDYAPLETSLGQGQTKRIVPDGGRPSNAQWPYFNLEWGGRGLIVAVGWPGQWAAEFARHDSHSLQVRAGQELTHLKLLPDEEIRTPLIALQFWEGDWGRAQNIWRRWMLAHNLPRPGGRLPRVQMAGCSSHQFGEMIHATSANQRQFIDRYLQERLPLDYWWMDAGWYPCDGQWPKTGTWQVDQRRFPGGLRAVADHAHARNVKTIVWFEPERVASGGRRNDLETLRRAVPLLRSDYIMEPVGNQGHTYGMSFWVPFQGTGTGSGEISPYLLRSAMVTHFTACFDVRRKDLDYEQIRRWLKQWRDYAPYYFGDYYPLTPYNLDAASWIAWQFDVPETGEGMIQAFRRDQSVYETARFQPRGLDTTREYEIADIDESVVRRFSGRELLERGILVTVPQRPGAVVIVYRRIGPK